MTRRLPPVLARINTLRTGWKQEKWRREKFCRGKRRDQYIAQAERMLCEIDLLEQWCRARMKEEELESLVQ